MLKIQIQIIQSKVKNIIQINIIPKVEKQLIRDIWHQGFESGVLTITESRSGWQNDFFYQEDLGHLHGNYTSSEIERLGKAVILKKEFVDRLTSADKGIFSQQ